MYLPLTIMVGHARGDRDSGEPCEFERSSVVVQCPSCVGLRHGFLQGVAAHSREGVRRDLERGQEARDPFVGREAGVVPAGELTRDLGVCLGSTFEFAGDVVDHRLGAPFGALAGEGKRDHVHGVGEARFPGLEEWLGRAPPACIDDEVQHFDPVRVRREERPMDLLGAPALFVAVGDPFGVGLCCGRGRRGGERDGRDESEPPRVSRRLQTLRDWSDETFKQILPGASGTGSAVGPGSPGRARLAMGGHRLGVVEDRLLGPRRCANGYVKQSAMKVFDPG